MTRAGVVEALGNKRGGQVFTVEMVTDAKVRVGSPNIKKHTRVQGQMCEYGNRKPVAEAVAEGVRGEPVTPAYVDHVDHIGAVRIWVGNMGQEYLPVVLFGKNAMQTDWFVDGKPTTKDAVGAWLLAAETRPKRECPEGQVPFLCVKLENIISIK